MLLLAAGPGVRDLPVEVRPQMLYNPAMRSPNFFVPGVIGMALQIATVFAAAMSIVRERERGTLEKLLVSPLSRWGLMLGKLVPYLCISMMMAVGLFAIMRWVFNVPMPGDVMALLVATLLYVFALLSLGLLISTRAQNQMQALQMCMIFILPSVFFSGFIFPRETMPWIFYAIGAVLPATYYIELQRAIVLRGASLGDFWLNIVILAGMGWRSSACARCGSSRRSREKAAWTDACVFGETDTSAVLVPQLERISMNSVASPTP